MNIQRTSLLSPFQGPSEWFTGEVHVEMLFDAQGPARVSGANVTFEPGARTAWHSHPLGQRLLVTAGWGRVQARGGRSRRSEPVMSCASRRAKSTGTGRRQRRQ